MAADGREDARRERFRKMDEGAQPPPPRGNGPDRDDQRELPRPLHREIPPGDPFPVEALGPLRSAAEAIHQIVQAPLAICAQAVLGTATLATQCIADIELPYGAVRPLSIYSVVVASTGERKSAADSFAAAPIHSWERERFEAFDRLRMCYEAARDAFDAERKRILGEKKKTRADKQAELEALGLPPLPPPSPILVAGEPTYEGLFRMLREGPRSVGIFSTEGGQFVGGFSMSEDHRMRTAAALSEGWDGLPWKRVRGGDGLIVLPNRRVTLNLMLQPVIVPSFLGDEFLIGQGLVSRLLVTAPPSAAGARFFKEPPPESQRVLAQYEKMILELLRLGHEREAEEDADPRNEPLPVLTFAPEARELWIRFADHIERQLGRDGELVPVAGFANKAPEHAGRLAGSVCLLEDPEAKRPRAEHLERGIALVEHYISEGLRLRAAAQVNEPLRRAARLLAWLQESWTEPVISLVEIYRLGPPEFRDKATAAEAVRPLEEHGWLRRLDGSHEVNGVKRREVWLVVREGAR